MIIISGKTFEHRDALKQMGARWNNDNKTWQTPAVTTSEMQRIRSWVGVHVRDTSLEKKEKPRINLEQIVADNMSALNEKRRDRKREIDERKPNFFGDDRTWLNYFEAQYNPTSFFGFSSLNEFRKFIKDAPQSIIDDRTNDRNDPWRYASGWHGTRDMETALRLARDGWPEGVTMAERFVEELTGLHAQEKRRKYTLAGGSVNIGRLLADNPKHMRTRDKQPGKQVITFFAESAMSSSIPESFAIVRAALIAAIVDILEGKGFSCEIVAIATAQFHNKPSWQVATNLKAAGEPLSLNDVVFALGHPAYFRRMCLGAIAFDEALWSVWETAGRPADPFNKYNPPQSNEFYIERIDHDDRHSVNRNGSDLDMALSIWDLITTKELPINIKPEE